MKPSLENKPSSSPSATSKLQCAPSRKKPTLSGNSTPASRSSSFLTFSTKTPPTPSLSTTSRSAPTVLLSKPLPSLPPTKKAPASTLASVPASRTPLPSPPRPLPRQAKRSPTYEQPKRPHHRPSLQNLLKASPRHLPKTRRPDL